MRSPLGITPKTSTNESKAGNVVIEIASVIGNSKEVQSDSAVCESVAGRVYVVTDASAIQSVNTLETNLSRGYWQSTFNESLSQGYCQSTFDESLS